MKHFENPSCYILEELNKNYDKKKFHISLKIYGAPKLLLCSKITNFPPSEGVSEITFDSICSRSLGIVINCVLGIAPLPKW